MFVPGSTLSGPGIEPVLAEMIKVSGEDLIPALDFQAYEYNEQNASVQLLPDLLRKYSQDELKDQLIKGLEHHTKYLQFCRAVLAAVNVAYAIPRTQMRTSTNGERGLAFQHTQTWWFMSLMALEVDRYHSHPHVKRFT